MTYPRSALVTATEWSVCYIHPAGYAPELRDKVKLSVTKVFEDPINGSEIQKLIVHHSLHGKIFDSVEEAKSFALQKGLIKRSC